MLQCYRELILPLVSRRILCYMPKVDCPFLGYVQFAQKHFARYVRRRTKRSTFMYQKSIRGDQLYLYRQGHILARFESWASSAFACRLEYSYPLLDKRLVEFALSQPAELYYREGVSRFLFRHAVADILPEEIRTGNFKYEPNRIEHILKTEQEAFAYLLEAYSWDDACLREHRYIDRDKLRLAMEKFVNREIAFKKNNIQTINEIEKAFLLATLGSRR